MIPETRQKTRVVASVVASLLTSALVTLGAAGVSAGAAASSGKVQTVHYWYWEDDPAVPTVPDLISKFNATHPGIHVVGQLVPFNSYQQKLTDAVAAGDAPDAARFKDWWLGEYAHKHLLVSLTPDIHKWTFASDVVSKYWDTGRTSPTSPVYMLPDEYITFYLYYRKDWFAAAHLSPPRTFSQFVADAKKLTDPARHRYGFAMRGGGGGQDQWYAFLAAGGARLVNRHGQVVANSPKAIAVNQWYIDLVRKYHVAPPTAVSDSYPQLIADFEAGETAMMAHHIGSYTILKDALGNKLGVVPMPQANPSHPGTMGTMTGNVIFRSSPVQQAAWTFISWLSSPYAINILDHSPNAELPILKSVVDEPYFQKNPFWKVALDEEKYAHDWPPLPGVAAVSGHVWERTMDQALLGQITSRQMMDTIAATLKGK